MQQRAMINGDGTIGGRTVEDIVAEFGEKYHQSNTNYSLKLLTEDLGTQLQHLIDDFLNDLAEEFDVPLDNLFREPELEKFLPKLEVIVGGYSKGPMAENKRYGEIYSLTWHPNIAALNRPYRSRMLSIYNKDREFGTHYGGQNWMLDRFQYGIDENVIHTMWLRRDLLFANVQKYVLEQLRAKKIPIPDNIEIDVPSRLSQFDIYKLFSEYQRSGKGSDIVQNVKKGMVHKLKTMEAYFSLQTAVNYCSFLMSCAYAENMFTLIIPTVGSEMRIASITRDDGYQPRRTWQIQSPGPPFVG